MTDRTRITVQTVITTPMTSQIQRADLTEFLAACHRHDIPADGKVTVDHKVDERGGPGWFRLVATKTLEQGEP